MVNISNLRLYHCLRVMSESSERTVDGEPIVQKSDSNDVITESLDSSEHSSPHDQELTQTDSLNNHSNSSTSHEDPSSTSHKQDPRVQSEGGDVRATSPESGESVGSNVRVEDVILSEKSPAERDRPKPLLLSPNTSDSEASVPRHSPGLYTSGNSYQQDQ